MKKGQKVRLNDKFDVLADNDVVAGIKVLDWRRIFKENKGYAKVKRIDYNNGFVIVDLSKYSMGLVMYKMFLK